MANWPPWVFYGSYAISHSNCHILPSLASLANFHLTNPQAFIFDFGPGGVLLSSRSLQAPYGSYSPWAAKGGNNLAPKARWVPKPQLNPPEPKLVTNPLDPKLAKDLVDTNLAINPLGPIFGHGPPWTNISAMASGNYQRPPDQLGQPSPQHMGNSFHFFIPSILEVGGLVHIWYYIPLCTIFAQQSNGDVFNTHFHLSISRSQNPMPTLKEDYSTHQSDKVWRQSEDSSRILTTSICRSWVGKLFRIIQKGQFSRGITSIQSVVKASSISILLGQLNSSIQDSFNQPVWPRPNWAISHYTV
ncbi:hypothetical protein O181_108823 [Austropuccinia psidii MF-1]|uniref:Uncharacterized protein n=1 Tax=Austropuccinia psidii MF-1 TaxID=1389203 RepID=A0A9Q3JTJ5_9BASI|nr:hypothetical protein [Austropuccinia psidii MF-1]